MSVQSQAREAIFVNQLTPPPKKKKERERKNDKLGTCFVLSFIESGAKEK